MESNTLRHLPQRAHLKPVAIAKFLGISTQQIYKMIGCDGFPSVRIGRLIRVPRDEFEVWYKELCKAYSDPEA